MGKKKKKTLDHQEKSLCLAMVGLDLKQETLKKDGAVNDQNEDDHEDYGTEDKADDGIVAERTRGTNGASPSSPKKYTVSSDHVPDAEWIKSASEQDIFEYLFSGKFNFNLFKSTKGLSEDETYDEISNILWPVLLQSMEDDWIEIFGEAIINNYDLRKELTTAYFDYYIKYNRMVSPAVNSLFNWTRVPFNRVKHVVLGFQSNDPSGVDKSNGLAYSVMRHEDNSFIQDMAVKNLTKCLGMAFGDSKQQMFYSIIDPKNIQVKNFDLIQFSKTSGVLFLNIFGSFTEFCPDNDGINFDVNLSVLRLRQAWAKLHTIILDTLITVRDVEILGLYDVVREDESKEDDVLESNFATVRPVIELLRRKPYGYSAVEKNPVSRILFVDKWSGSEYFLKSSSYLAQFPVLKPLLDISSDNRDVIPKNKASKKNTSSSSKGILKSDKADVEKEPGIINLPSGVDVTKSDHVLKISTVKSLKKPKEFLPKPVAPQVRSKVTVASLRSGRADDEVELTKERRQINTYVTLRRETWYPKHFKK